MKKFLRVVIFFAVFLLLFSGVSHILAVGVDRNSASAMGGFYSEPKNSLDAVYIGSSNCLAFWNPLFAWEQYGITVYPCASISQQLTAAEYIIKDVLKTQDDPVFLININTLGSRTNTPSLHRLFDNMPFSLNRIQAIESMGEMYGLTRDQITELHFPILRYHSRWSKLQAEDFSVPLYKGAFDNDKYWDVSYNISAAYTTVEGEVRPSDHVMNSLERLLDLCDEKNLKVVFVTVPRKETNVKKYQRYNYINKLVEERGYHVLDMMDKVDEMQLDLRRDFYGKTHTNVHGSLKLTQYVSEYLIENFKLENKKGDPAYASWDEQYAAYKKLAEIRMQEFEFSGAARDNTLQAPKNVRITRGEGLTVSFDAVKGAEGYTICKRVGENGAWKTIGETKTLSFTDNDFKKDGTYYYTVVPTREQDGETVYGNCEYGGVKLVLKNGKVQ